MINNSPNINYYLQDKKYIPKYAYYVNKNKNLSSYLHDIKDVLLFLFVKIPWLILH